MPQLVAQATVNLFAGPPAAQAGLSENASGELVDDERARGIARSGTDGAQDAVDVEERQRPSAGRTSGMRWRPVRRRICLEHCQAVRP